MATTPTVYVICDQNCKFEGMTKEQILTAITNAVSTGDIGDVNTGFVQTVKTINGKALKFFVGTQSEYDRLSAEDKQDLYAIITNDTTREGIITAIESLQAEFVGLRDTVNNILTGKTKVPKADSAVTSTNVSGVESAYNEGRFVWFSSSPHEKRAYNSNFKYNPATNTLQVGKVDGTAAEAEHAAEADIADSAGKAGYLESIDGTKFSRSRLWRNSNLIISDSSVGFMEASVTGSIDLSAVATTLKGKWLVAEVSKLVEAEVADIYSSKYRFRTCAFCLNTETANYVASAAFAQNIDGANFIFWVNGSTLYYRSNETGFYLEAIYEEM